MANFAKRMDNIKASDIRQLLKIIGQPGIISFAGGLPAPELFPVEDFKAALDAVMEENGRVAMQYGATEGWAPLRKQIVERLDPRGLPGRDGGPAAADRTGRLHMVLVKALN